MATHAWHHACNHRPIPAAPVVAANNSFKPKPLRGSAYFQYRRNCNERIELTNALLSAADIHLSAPLSNQPVVPSTKTIAVVGPAWRD